jgi:hypothetical protein
MYKILVSIAPVNPVIAITPIQPGSNFHTYKQQNATNLTIKPINPKLDLPSRQAISEQPTASSMLNSSCIKGNENTSPKNRDLPNNPTVCSKSR